MYDKIKILLTESNQLLMTKLYKERKYEEAIEYAIRAIQCAELINDMESIMENRLFLGHIYLNSMKDLNYAVKIYTDILEKLKELKEKGIELKKRPYYHLTNYALARTLRKLGKADQAIPILEEVAMQFKNMEYRVLSLNDLGLIYWLKGSLVQNDFFLDEAIKVYNQALEFCDAEAVDNMAMLLNNKGMAYYSKKQYDQAIEVFNKALSLTDDVYYVACISNEVAKTYIKLGNYHRAKEYINKANQILIDYDERVADVELLRNIAIEGLYQRKIGNFEDAVKYFEMSATKLEDQELKVEAAETFHQLSLILKERGDIRSGRYALKFEELAKEIEEKRYS